MDIDMKEIINRLENLKVSDTDINEFKGVLIRIMNLYEDAYDTILNKLKNETLTKEQINDILKIFHMNSYFVLCWTHIDKNEDIDYEDLYEAWLDDFDNDIETFNDFIKAYGDGCRYWEVSPYKDHWVWIDGNGEFCVYKDDDMQDFFYRMIDDEKNGRTMNIEAIKSIFRIING